jgi:hypothetical protein
LCYGYLGEEAKRPTRFAAKNGDKQILVVLKRIFGPEVFPFRRADGTRTFPPIIEKANEPVQPPPIHLDSPPAQATAASVPANLPSYSARTEVKRQDAQVKLERKPEDYDAIFQNALDVVDDLFEIAYANRYDGRIETANRPEKATESPPVRQRAIVQITGDDDGGFLVRIQVRREAAEVMAARFDNKPPRLVRETDWKFIGRDIELEQVMLKRLVEKNRKEKSRALQTRKKDGEQREHEATEREPQHGLSLRSVQLNVVNPDRTISVTTLNKHATIYILPVAQDAKIKVKGGNTFAALKIGRRLSLRLKVVDDQLVVTEIRQEGSSAPSLSPPSKEREKE